MSTPVSPQPAGQVPANAHPMAGPPPGAMPAARLPSQLPEDGRSTPIGFGRLVAVELRKTVDTRAGKWLLGLSLGLMLLICVGISFTSDMKRQPQFGNYLSTSVIALKFILPILGIMAVTSEWSQRTGLVTFALEPRRTRVGLAKWVAALILGIIVITFTVAIAAVMALVMQALTNPHDSVWDFGASRIGWFYVIFLLFVSMGVAFGLLLQNTPAAICAFLFVPIAFSIITSFSALRSFGEWADANQSLFPLLDDGGERPSNLWGKILVGQLIWLVIPMVIGFLRLNRREVKSS